ncbi:YHYH domain-containing protein [Phenylobacterium sp.]|uniref:YHYH domain-containing protein n=1 Tax=Phenylobacterium sp. TaxID=1871053 RepID=UPI003525C0B0
MKLLLVAAISLFASTAFAHETPPKSQSASAPKASPLKPVMKPANGHSGGTDAYGCHTNSQTGEYHCHKPK